MLFILDNVFKTVNLVSEDFVFFALQPSVKCTYLARSRRILCVRITEMLQWHPDVVN